MRREAGCRNRLTNHYEMGWQQWHYRETECPVGIYVDRIADGHSHHCASGGAVVAGAVVGPGKRQTHLLPEQSKATGSGLADVRRWKPRRAGAERLGIFARRTSPKVRPTPGSWATPVWTRTPPRSPAVQFIRTSKICGFTVARPTAAWFWARASRFCAPIP